MEAPTEGPAKGKTLAPHLKELILGYYKEMGWDENGIPTKETLRKLDLEEEARGLIQY
jgi:aldehyde:ferredoxin oxidoreductase